MSYFSDNSFPLQEESRVGATKYESVIGKLPGVTKDNCCKYNKFKDEDHDTTGKYAAIYGTAAALRKSKKLYPHYRLTESTVKAMREKYRIVNPPSSSLLIKKLTLLKRGRPLLLENKNAKSF